MKSFDILITDRSDGSNCTVDVSYGDHDFEVTVDDREPEDVWGLIIQRIVEEVAVEIGEEPDWIATDWHLLGQSRRRLNLQLQVGDAVRIDVEHV